MTFQEQNEVTTGSSETVCIVILCLNCCIETAGNRQGTGSINSCGGSNLLSGLAVSDTRVQHCPFICRELRAEK